MMDYLMMQPNVMPRLNPRILADDTRLLDLTAKIGILISALNIQMLKLKVPMENTWLLVWFVLHMNRQGRPSKIN